MTTEEEKLRHSWRRKRNLIAMSLRNNERNFRPKIVLNKKDEPEDVRLSDIRSGKYERDSD